MRRRKLLPFTELISEPDVRVKALRESRNISSTGPYVRLGNFILCNKLFYFHSEMVICSENGALIATLWRGGA